MSTIRNIVYKNLYTSTFRVHFTLFVCAHFCPVEWLITVHMIHVATATHKKPVLW